MSDPDEELAGDVVEVALVPVRTDPPQVLDHAPSATVVVDRRATPSTGIAFAVVVRNDDLEPMRLDQPYEGISYTLADADGWPVQLDAPTRRAKVDGPSPRLEAKRAYLDVHAVRIDRDDVDVATWLAGDVVELGAAGSLEFDVVVSRVSGPGMDDAAPVPLRPGTYSLSVLLPLAWTAAGARGRLVLTTDQPVNVEVEPD